MPGLLLIVTEAGGDRFAAAMELGATFAALDRPVAVLIRGAATRGLHEAGVAQALALLFEFGAGISVCQTAMAEHGLTAADLPAGVDTLGMVAFLQGRQGWQLLIV